MGKYEKNLLAEHYKSQIDGVADALLVNVIGLDNNTTVLLRGELEAKGINLLVIKNSMASRATADGPLAPMFAGGRLRGSSALCWGGEDIVSLAKEVTRLSKEPEYEGFETRAGVMDGESLDAAQVADVSKWPSRTEQISILVGQILAPGAGIAGQLNAAGGALASQIGQVGEE